MNMENSSVAGKVKRFEDLLCWQKGRELVREIYRSSENWRDRSLQDQIRRASVSVISNIAEGFERGTKNDTLYFLYIARGSVGEVRSQLYISKDLGLVSDVQFDMLYDLADFVARLLYKLIESYRFKSYGGQRVGDKGVVMQKEIDEFMKRLIDKQIKERESR
jgi:four helix bundle protein